MPPPVPRLPDVHWPTTSRPGRSPSCRRSSRRLALSSAGLAYGAGPGDRRQERSRRRRQVSAATSIRLRVQVHDAAGKPLSGVTGTVFKLAMSRGGGMLDSGPSIKQTGTTSPSTAEGLDESAALPVDGLRARAPRGWLCAGVAPDPPAAVGHCGAADCLCCGGSARSPEPSSTGKGRGSPRRPSFKRETGTKRLEAITDANGRCAGGVPEGGHCLLRGDGLSLSWNHARLPVARCEDRAGSCDWLYPTRRAHAGGRCGAPVVGSEASGGRCRGSASP